MGDLIQISEFLEKKILEQKEIIEENKFCDYSWSYIEAQDDGHGYQLLIA